MYYGDIRLLDRLSEGVAYAPPGLDSVRNSLWGDPSFLAPFGKRKFDSFIFNEPTASPVAGLDFAGRPNAVGGTVRPVVIKPLNRVIRGRARPHVGEEVFKRLKPPMANKNPSGSVVLPILAVGVRAAAFDVAPNVPLWADAPFSGHSVGCKALSNDFGSETSATDAGAVSQRRSINGFFRTAIAAARPKAQVVSAKNRPPTKSAPGHFYEFWHGLKFTTDSGDK